ncbi:MAG: hydroxymethylglutaryl-CoA reductase, degradative [Candidatus Helarchaeales archaeon]
MVDSSKLEKFYKKSLQERLEILQEKLHLSDNEIKLLEQGANGKNILGILDGMIENVVGIFPMPIGMATNFIINGKERLITMVIEEPSVVAAASNVARMTRPHGGFHAEPVKSFMIGQIQLLDVNDVAKTKEKILEHEQELLDLANKQDPVLVKMGGGAKEIKIHEVSTSRGMMLDVHLIVNCLDAMGANAVNTMVEAIAPLLEKITGCKSLLKIISNLAIHRVAKCKAVFDKDMLGGEEVVSGILDATEFARNDIYRAATHNKGIMNGVSAVVRATGNDTRAVEAGAHAYAAFNRDYQPLTSFSTDSDGNLVGEIEIPVAVGTIGGATRSHPLARLCLKIMEISNAEDLSQVIAAVGLAQNVAALRALVSEGIQKGHMKLHARNIVKMAGIPPEHEDQVLERLIKSGKIRIDVAKKIHEELIAEKNSSQR